MMAFYELYTGKPTVYHIITTAERYHNIIIVILMKAVIYKYSLISNLNIDLYIFQFQAISWRSVLFMEEIGVPRENHRPTASRCQTYYTTT
jgi:hypothetical protein